MLVYRDKYLDEAINFNALNTLFYHNDPDRSKHVDSKRKNRYLGPDYKDNEEKLLNIVLNNVDKNNKPLTDKDLRAYGTSKKELIEAIKLIVAYWEAPDDAKTQEVLNKFRKFNKDGDLRDSLAFQFVKDALDKMPDDEYEDLVITLEDDDGPEYFEYLDSDCAKMFNISKEEAERSFDSNRSRLRGYMVKAGAKRKIKKVGNKIKDTVKSKVKAVKDFGDKIRGFFS